MIDAFAIGGSSCGNFLDPSGGHGAPSSITNTSILMNGFSAGGDPGRDATCWGGGGGGGYSFGLADAEGGNGKRGIVIIKIKNAT